MEKLSFSFCISVSLTSEYNDSKESIFFALDRGHLSQFVHTVNLKELMKYGT